VFYVLISLILDAGQRFGEIFLAVEGAGHDGDQRVFSGLDHLHIFLLI